MNDNQPTKKPIRTLLSNDTMASSDDYESLPESMHPAIHMGAGALAGIGEHCVMYPVDVVKVNRLTSAAAAIRSRIECLDPNAMSQSGSAREISRHLPCYPRNDDE